MNELDATKEQSENKILIYPVVADQDFVGRLSLAGLRSRGKQLNATCERNTEMISGLFSGECGLLKESQRGLLTNHATRVLCSVTTSELRRNMSLGNQASQSSQVLKVTTLVFVHSTVAVSLFAEVCRTRPGSLKICGNVRRHRHGRNSSGRRRCQLSALSSLTCSGELPPRRAGMCIQKILGCTSGGLDRRDYLAADRPGSCETANRNCPPKLPCLSIAGKTMGLPDISRSRLKFRPAVLSAA